MRAFRPLSLILIVFAVWGAVPHIAAAQELDFLEDYVLAEDRETALKQLVPGTEPYYYYHCLHYQNQRQLDRVDTMLEPWKKRFGESALYQQIVNRQMLLEYTRSPQDTLAYLKRKLNLRFNHQREIPTAERQLPTALDQNLINSQRLLAQALSHSGLEKISDPGLRELAGKPLNRTQRKQLLQRLTLPDFPGLVELIHQELKERDARKFGQLPIHRTLTLKQLDQLASLRPRLKSENDFVMTYLSKLAPSNDVAWRLDVAAHREYLQQLWKFVEPLDPTFNSLKANVLYRWLALDLEQERFDRERFMTYLKLPRNAFYVNPVWVRNVRSNSHLVQLGRDYSSATQLRPIGSDDQLVQEYLQHFLRDADGYREFEPYVRDTFLKQQFAEAKILAGLGDVEKWASMLSPEQYKALLERVDLKFASTNPEYFDVDAPVELALDIKNVDNLIIKVFEINTLNYYREYGRQIDTDITLDGLVANWEQTHQFDQPPAIQKRHQFKFPELDKRGVYVIDFIAGGKSSRALIRKGRLQFIDQLTAAGHQLTVIDQDAQPVKDATIWLAGRRYRPNDDGQVMIPFSTQPGPVEAIMTQGDFSCMQTLFHQSESYQLKAAMTVDREALTRGNRARLIIRPSLDVAGSVPSSVKLLEDVKLVISTTNLDGVSAENTQTDIELQDNQETACEFVVPPRLHQINFALTATIKNVSTGQTQSLSANQSYTINSIDKSDMIQDLHLIPSRDGYRIEVLGKSGEQRVGQSVRVSLKVDGFQDEVYTDLQSDENGMVQLGQLENVQYVTANLTAGTKKTWPLKTQDQTYNQTIHIAKGQAIEIPAPAGIGDVRPEFVTLLEIRRGQFVQDWIESVSIEKGLVRISELPPGDFRLQLRAPVTTADGQYRHSVLIRVSAGKRAGQALVSPARQLQLANQKRMQLSAIGGNNEKVRIELENATDDTRVHVIATRYLPAFDTYQEMAPLSRFEPWLQRPADRRSVYLEGRKIGEEYEYILRRKYAAKYPGNTLQRPSLLLNPWAVRDTSNDAQDANKGDEFRPSGSEDDEASSRARESRRQAAGNTDFANLNYLGDGSVILLNLKPNDAGIVTVDREKLGNGHHIRVIAANAFETVQRNISFDVAPLKPRDARLANALDPEKHYAQSKQTEMLSAGDTIKVDDLVSAKFQQYDDLADAYTLLQTLGNHQHLATFRFVLDWLEKDDAEKRKLYSEHACHELNFFLFKKDPEFFKSVVLPHLQNKRARTFMDHYLLGSDLEGYTQPWQFARLNTVERILLAQRLRERRNDIVRSIRESYLVSPTPRAQIDRYYDFGITALGIDATQTEVLERMKQVELMDRLESKTRNLPQLGAQVNRLGDARPSPSGGLGGGGAGGRAGGYASDAPGQAPAAMLPPAAEKARGRFSADKKADLYFQNGQNLAGRKGKNELQEGLDFDGVADASRAMPSFRQFSGGEILNDEESGAISIAGDPGDIALVRKELKRLYRRLQPTKEWIESNYYRLQPKQTTPELVPINQFWRDYAEHDQGAFLSPYFAEASRTFTEAMFALSVLDLPLKSPENEIDFVDNSMTFKAGGPAIVLHQQVRDAVLNRGNTEILVSENFFQKNDRYRHEDGVRYDKFVSEEFLAHTLYGGQVVITNPTSTPRAIELLIQIPRGSVSCSGSQETRTIQMDLNAFSTKTFEYYFYFPTAGDFQHYPAHVSAKQQVLALADNTNFHVVDRQAELDKESWEFVSQNGTDDEVIDFLNSHNVKRLDLSKIAFRMKDQGFFKLIVNVLRNRYIYSGVLWSYGIEHNDVATIREYLTHDNAITNNVGIEFDSELLTVDPVARDWYWHKEYWPLINARAHQLGPQRKILNPDFYAQYQSLLAVLAQHRELGDDDHLVMTYYLLLQDRIESALDHFGKVSRDNIEFKIQYDYCDAYLDFYREQPEAAAVKAAVWADYPVEHWQQRFQAILAQVDEIKGGENQVTDDDDAMQEQTKLAAKAETIDLEIAAGVAKLRFQNVKQVDVNFYEMDIELLFSRNPFAQDELDGFSMIRPNQTMTLELKPDEAGKGNVELEIPDSMRNKNVLIEVVAGDQVRSQPFYAHSLDVKLAENYGQVQVIDDETGKPLSKSYVKVYARMNDGRERFHKDGYTDLRGRFDYVSQSNRSLDGIREYSILVMSEDNGSVIRQANPPRE